MTQRTATLIGFCAILLWALLTLLTVWSAPVPPFQLNAICFLIAAIMGAVWVQKTNAWAELRAIPLGVYAFGAAGIFGYHFLFFSAIRLAPAAEASLINYFWPLLIVLFSGLLPGETLKRAHILGAVIALGGAILLLARGTAFSAEAISGYLFAAGAAFAWSSYSVLSRRLGHVPTSAVAVFCLIAALGSALCHFIFETTAWPQTTLGWMSVLLLGLGPAGGAFFVWDIGMKRGDIQLLGTASYAAPLISTVILVGVGIATATPVLALSAILISGGALIAALASKS